MQYAAGWACAKSAASSGIREKRSPGIRRKRMNSQGSEPKRRGCGMTSIMVVSDIHYLAPEYYQGSQLFLRALANSDGKLTQHSEVLIQALKR